MNQQTFERASALFAEVCTLEEPERSARLDALCAGEAELRLLVEDLLAADQESSWFLDRPPEEGAGAVLAQDLLREAEEHQDTPTRLGSYRVLRRLGEGGMGVVFEAEQDHPRRLVALKCVHPWLLSDDLRERFRFEAQAMGQLLHPGIPQVYEAGTQGDTLFLAMERVEGRGLLRFADEEGLDVDARLELLARICDAVHHAHERGVVHCDLKPANVLVTHEGQPKVLDFGIAGARHQEGARKVIGTPRYMSPEQLRGQTPSPTWDVFSLGVVGFELVEGKAPFCPTTRYTEEALRCIAQGPPPLTRGSPDLEAVLARAVAAEPEQRYASAAALERDLRRLLTHRRPEAVSPSLIPDLRRGARRHQSALRWLGAVAGAVVLAVGGAWGIQALVAQRAHQQREAAALAHWEVTFERMVPLDEAGEHEQAQAIFTSFIEAEEHRGTWALSEAWGVRSAWLGNHELWDESLHAASMAYLHAQDRRQRVDSLERLGQELLQREDWQGLAAVSSALEREGAPSAELTRATDLASGHWERPTWSDHPLLSELVHARRLPLQDVIRAWSVDLDADGHPEVLAANLQGFELLDAQERVHEVVLPDGPPSWFSWLPGSRTLVVQHAEHEPPVVRGYALDADTLGGAQPGIRWEIEEEALRSAVEVDLDGDGVDELYLGTGPYTRHLLRLDPQEGWIPVDAHPPTTLASSDILAMTTADLDEDGRPELVAAVSWWRARDVRVFGPGTEHPLVLLDRQRVGAVQSLAAVHTSQGERLFLMASPAPGEEEHQEILASWSDGALSLERASVRLPRPLERARWGEAVTGDVNGDGREEVLVSADVNRVDAVVLDDLGDDLPALRLPHLDRLGAWDHDGDRDDEVAVEVGPDKDIWLLGTGTDHLPPLMETPNLEAVSPGLHRTEDLWSMGLVEGAALAAELEASTSPHPAEALAWAAARRTDLGQHALAYDLLERALDMEPGDPSLLEALARCLARLHDYDAALNLWRLLPERPADLEWLAEVARPPPEVRLDFSQPLHPGWRIHEPGAVHRVGSQGALVLDPLSGSGRLASLPVRRTSELVEISLDLHLSQVELGSALAVQLWCGPADRPPLRAWVRFHGGGGEVGRSIHMGGGHDHVGVDRALIDPETYTEDLHLVLHHARPTGAVDASVRSAQGLPGYDLRIPAEPLPQTDRCELVFALSEHPGMGYPQHLRAEVRDLRLTGLEPLPAQADARNLLADGQPLQALSALDEDDLPARTVALADLGRLGQAAASLAQVLQSGAPEGRLLLRHLDPVLGPLLATHMGPEPYWAAWNDAHFECLGRNSWCTSTLLRPRFAALTGQGPVQSSLLLDRARAAREQGQDQRALADLRTLLEGPPSAQHVDACLLEAELLCERGERDLAQADLDLAAATSPTPELVEDRIQSRFGPFDERGLVCPSPPR